MSRHGRLMLLLVAATAAAQDSSDKITAEVRQALSRGAATLPLFLELSDQPQAEVLQRMERESARLTLAKDNFERLASYGSAAPAKDLDDAREELDSAIGSVRQAAARAIQDRIRPGQDNVTAALAGVGATDIRPYFVVNVLRADVPASAVDFIASRAEVVRIALIGSGKIALNTTAALGAPAFWNATPAYTGKGQIVAVLDTGINEKNPALVGPAYTDAIFLDSAIKNPDKNCAWGEPNNPPTAADYVGHGTAIADAIAGQGIGATPTPLRGVAFGVQRILNVKVLYKCTGDGQGASFQTDDVLNGLQYAVFGPNPAALPNPLAASIINLSFGGGADAGTIRDYVDRIVELSNNPLVFTAAAGNDGPDGGTILPGAATAYNVITVGAEIMDANGVLEMKPADFSSRGPVGSRAKPDLLAPGMNLQLANAAYVLGGGQPIYENGVEGTSFSAPQVAGAAALLRNLGVPNSVAVKALLINSAVRNPGDDPWTAAGGWGYMRLGALPALLQRHDGKPVCEQGGTYASACLLDTVANKGDRRYYEAKVAGAFKATLVWNRHFTNKNDLWTAANAPLAINNLSLTLYQSTAVGYANADESNDTADNVQQVNVTEGAATDIVVKVKLPGNPVAGVAQEPYALASSIALTPRGGPMPSVFCAAPANVQPQQTVPVPCTASNTGDLALFSVTVSSDAGAVSNGSLGTIAAGGSAEFTVTVTVPAAGSLATTVNMTGTLAQETYTTSTTFTITPAPGNCGYSASPAVVNVLDSTGQTGTIQVTAPSGCPWTVFITALSSPRAGAINSWISVSPMSGTGNGVVSYTVPPNLFPASEGPLEGAVDFGQLTGSYQNAIVGFSVCGAIVNNVCE
jgi:subtilisin family serine protease